MMKTGMFYMLLLLCFDAVAQNKAYYISPAGSDSNDGLSAATAWRTFTNVNALSLQPGDKILLQGGQNFNGTLQLDSADNGTASNPIIISSYGGGSATINATSNAAFKAFNSGGLSITNLVFKGDGSNADGMQFFITQKSANISFIYIDSIEVMGFGGRGFLMGANQTDKGFTDVTVMHSSFHDNGRSGFETFGNYPLFSHSNFEIGYCKFYNNLGIPSFTATTGNGIVVSGVNGATVEYCEAYNNGANNRAPGGGPVGIWVYDAKNVTIQYCESHHNKAGMLKDGGGFDIDGGSENCTVQYCYSHDNEGPGLAIVEYGSNNSFTGNIVRYNISQNDARKNSCDALSFFAVDAQHQVNNTEVYNNTIYVDASNLTNGKPSAINIQSPNFSGVHVQNNIFYITSDVNMLDSASAISPSQINFQYNNYYSQASTYDFWWNGIDYSSLNNWQIASGEETDSGVLVGKSQNPLLQDAGTGSTIHPADGGSFNALFGYFLNPFSPLVEKAVTIANRGTHDFFGNTLPPSSIDVGAAQALNVTSVLPLVILDFSAERTVDAVQLKWSVANENYLDKYEIQKSPDGFHFTTIGFIPAANLNAYLFLDKGEKGKKVFYRIQYIYPNGKYGLSKTISVAEPQKIYSSVFYKEGTGLELQINSMQENKVAIYIYSASGSLMHTSIQNIIEGANFITIGKALQWKNGTYFVKLISDTTEVVKFIK